MSNLAKNAAVLLAAVVTTGLAQAAAPFDQNLIVNGDAESGIGSSDGSTVASIPGFSTAGGFTVTQYGAGGGFPTSTDPGPADRGLNFFSGGPGNATGVSNATQLIDVSGGAATIDLGSTSFDLSAYLGGFSSQRDNAVLEVSFLSGAKAVLGSATVGSVSASDRSNQTGLLLRETNGVVPIGTRSIEVLLTMTRVDGSYNDGYADNLSLVLQAAAVPEPSSYALALAGLGSLAVLTRRRTRT